MGDHEPVRPDPERYKKLPEPVNLEDTVETSDVDPHPPLQDEAQETAWMLRHAGP
jgi:hypothetical protein